MRTRFLIALLIALTCVVLPPGAGRAQTPPDPQMPRIFPLTSSAQLHGDTIRVSMTFALKDRNGVPILQGSNSGQADITPEAKVSVSANGDPVTPNALPATVSPVTSPLKIVFLIDRSGSMNDPVYDVEGNPILGEDQKPLTRIQAARNAAKQAVAEAPNDAEFAIFSFAENSTLYQGGFLRKNTQLKTIHSAIENEIIPNKPRTGNTCIYDALNDAIGFIKAQVPAESLDRRAIILFTDGKDHEAGLCHNTLGVDSIINFAREAQETIIPIFSVAPCVRTEEDVCKDIDENALARLSEQTNASSYIKDARQMNTFFGQAVGVLKSQWMVQADVPAHQGANTATFTLQLHTNEDNPISVAVDFRSDVELRPTPTVQMKQGLLEDTQYRVQLTIANYQRIGALTLELCDSESSGKCLGEPHVIHNPGAGELLYIPATGLDLKHTYHLRVTATDRAGNPLAIALIDDQGAPQKTHPFTHESNLKLKVSSVTVAEDQSTLVVQVQSRGFVTRNWRTLINEVVFHSNEEDKSPSFTRSVISATEMTNTNSLQFVIPDVVPQDSLDHFYQVGLVLNEDTSDITVEPLDNIRIKRDKPPSWIAQLISSWITAPVLMSLAIALLLIVAFVIIRRYVIRRFAPDPYNLPGVTRIRPSPQVPANTKHRPAKGSASVIPKPPEIMHTNSTQLDRNDTVFTPDGTVLHVPDTRQHRLRIGIIQTPDATQVREEVVTHFPCIIGRTATINNGVTGVTGLVITGDEKISRAHVKITVEDGSIQIVDCKSSNGTFIDDSRLDAGGSALLKSRTLVRLGPHTTLELELQK